MEGLSASTPREGAKDKGQLETNIKKSLAADIVEKTKLLFVCHKMIFDDNDNKEEEEEVILTSLTYAANQKASTRCHCSRLY